MSKKIGQREIAGNIYEKVNRTIPKPIIESAIEQIADFLFDKLKNKNNIMINNFGTMSVYKRYPQYIYNVGTKERSQRDGYWCVKFIINENLRVLIKSRAEAFKE